MDELPFHVVTGGPGSGKSSLIKALQAAGYPVAEEAGRAVIQGQAEIDGPALPWSDPALFAELMLAHDLRSYREAALSAFPTFFDRGIPDVIGYLRLSGLAVPTHMETAARRFRYAGRAFIAPHWPEIYRRDAERRQDPAEAERTYRAMCETYPDFGYELVELPRAPVEARVRFVLETIQSG